MPEELNPVKVAVIGAGNHSQRVHLNILKKLQEQNVCKLLVLSDLDGQKASQAAEKFGFNKWTTDPERIFQDDMIEAVYVFGSVQMHIQYAKKAVQAGKHFFVEKPPAPRASDLLELLTQLQSKSLVGVVGFNRRFQKNITLTKKELSVTSTPSSFEATFHKPVEKRNVPFGAKTWFNAAAIHAVDVLCYWAGSLPQSVFSAKNALPQSDDQNFSALFKWKSGLHAVLASNHTAGSRVERYAAHGPGCSYICDGYDWVKNIVGRPDVYEAGEKSLEFEGFEEEHIEFLACIRNKRQPLHNLRHGYAALRLVELIEEGYCGDIDWSSLDNIATEANLSFEDALRRFPDSDQKQSILVLNPQVIGEGLARIYKEYKIIYLQDLDRMAIEDKAKICAVITGRGGKACDEELLRSLTGVKVVGIAGASVKQYGADSILSKGIALLNTAEVYAESVAEFTLMLAMLATRNASRSHDIMRKGGWGLNETIVSKNLNETVSILQKIKNKLKPPKKTKKQKIKAIKTLSNFKGSSVGILGWGAISKALVPYLRALECDIRVFSDYLTEEEAVAEGVFKCDLSHALNSRVVTLHRGLSKRTQHFLGSSELDLLKSGTVLINTARAELVDTKALIERLNRGDIFACLDVFDEEPLAADHPFRKMSNVFLTSHICGTEQLYQSSAQSIVDKILSYLNGDGESPARITDELYSNMT